MPKSKRSPTPPTDDWAQLRLVLTESVQEAYEIIRPAWERGRAA